MSLSILPAFSGPRKRSKGKRSKGKGSRKRRMEEMVTEGEQNSEDLDVMSGIKNETMVFNDFLCLFFGFSWLTIPRDPLHATA